MEGLVLVSVSRFANSNTAFDRALRYWNGEALFGFGRTETSDDFRATRGMPT